MLSLLIAPVVKPVSLDEAKLHARVEVDEDDSLIDGLISAATQHVEWYTERALEEQQWQLTLDSFPSCRTIDLPRPPLVSVEEIAYLDADGDEVAWDPANYRVIAAQGPFAPKGQIILRDGKSWPSVINEPASVFIRYTAGYSSYEDGVPEELKTAIKVEVAELYENRENTVLTGAVLQEVPYGVKALLWPFVVDKVI